MRIVIGILTGYALFAGSAVLLFQLAKVDPHAPATTGFTVFSILYGIAFASLGGFLAGVISRRRNLSAGLGLAVLITTGALISALARPGQGALWTQISAIVLFAPSAVLGHWLRNRYRSHERSDWKA